MISTFVADNLALLMLLAFAVLLFSGYPVALILAGVGLAFAFVGYLVDLFPLVAFYNVPLRVYGSINNSFIYPAVPMLLFMGVALEKSGVARDMLLCLRLLLGRTPGSLAIGVTLLGILLAPAAGLIGASVATLALVALPTMLEHGYRPTVATGSVAAAGTLGIVLPPGLMLFFLAEQMRVSVGQMFLSTIVPGLMLALLYIGYYLIRGRADPGMSARRADTTIAADGSLPFYILRSLALPALLIGLVLGSIIAGWATPPQSAAVGAVGSVVLMALNRRFELRLLHEVVVSTTVMTSMVFFVVIAATIFSYPFRFFGGDDLIGDFLQALGFGDWGVLVVILLTIFLLGFFIDWIEITIITLPIFYPVLAGLDFSAHVGGAGPAFVWMAVLIALVLQTSFLTPPFGFALFFLKGAAPPSVRLTEIYLGVVPIVLLQLSGIALVMALPLLATALPQALLP